MDAFCLPDCGSGRRIRPGDLRARRRRYARAVASLAFFRAQLQLAQGKGGAGAEPFQCPICIGGAEEGMLALTPCAHAYALPQGA